MTADARIDAYLDALPPEQRAALAHVRALVASAAPEAVETIAYGMPAFRLHGRFLVSFAGWRRHCTLYPLTGTFLVEHEAELAGYRRTKGSVHFTPERPLPDGLVEALVRARTADLGEGRR